MTKKHIFFALATFYGLLGVAAMAAAQKPMADAPKTMLNGPWTLTSTQNFTGEGPQISQTSYAPQNWMPAVVPGTVLTSYVHDGKFPDPYLDINNKRSENLIPDAGTPGTLFASPFWYRAMFRLDPSYRGKTIWLHLDGICYRADIFLNGQPVGKMAGMFKRGVFDVTGKAAVGANALAVKIYPLDTPGQPRDSGCGGDGHIGKTAAAMYATVGWDFTLVDGIRDRNIGIYRNVYVTKTGPVRLFDPFVITKSVPTAETANLSFQTSLTNATNAPVNGTLKVNIEGVGLVTQPVMLGPNETREVILDSSDHPGLTVAHPRLWWPIFQGKPELYGLRVSFVTNAGDVSDTLQTHFGIRTVTRDTSFHGQNTFFVNGRRTFIQGGNWVQDAMLRATRRGYEIKLRQMAQAGVNMLRCWSASAPESDDFYDVCDQLGIMVWTESGAAAQVWGPDDSKLQLDNWADVVRRIRSHPSQAYYCGANEGWPTGGTQEVTLANDPTLGYQDSSQANGQRGCPYRFLGIDTLYDYTAKDLFGSGQLGPFGGFCNETGNPFLPPADVLKQFIPPAKLWPTVSHPAFDEAIAYHDGAGFHQVKLLVNSGCARFGAFDLPDMAGRTKLENYGFKGQILGAMQGRAFSEVWKRNKWDEANKRYDTGFMFWTINSPNPMAAARLANYSGEPNAALFYFAHGNKPLHAQYDYFYNDVSVINDTAVPVSGLRVTAEVRNLDWSLKWQGEKTMNADADTSQNGLLSVPAKDTPGFDDVHFVVVELHDPAGKLLDRAIYWRAKNGLKYGADGPFEALNEMPMAHLAVKTAAAKTADGRQVVTAILTNPTPHLAFFTRLKIIRANSQTLVQPAEYSDDYFSLLPHETKTVTLTYDPADLGGEPAKLSVEGWNIHTLTLGRNSSGMTSPGPSLYQKAIVPLSLGRPVTASSTEAATGNVAANVTDGDLGTRWASQLGHDPEWISVDLGASHAITEVRLDWEAAAAKDYTIQTSEDGATWTTVKSVTGNTGAGSQKFAGLNAQGRYVRVYGTARVTPYGYSLYEFQVYGK